MHKTQMCNILSKLIYIRYVSVFHAHRPVSVFQLPAGSPPAADLTLAELQAMAARQQRVIEQQQQLMAAKEQRLRQLKAHELRQQQMSSENERLRQLRERVDAQELKLKKLISRE